MSFLLPRRGSHSSFLAVANIRQRMPNEGEVFREGYAYRKTPALLGTTTAWTRSFCILQHGELTFHASWEGLRDDASPLAAYKLNNAGDVRPPVGGGPDEIVVACPEWPTPLALRFETPGDAVLWINAISAEIQKQCGNDVVPPYVRARFFEGMLFKTPTEPTRWEERWFELTGDGELSYWQSRSSNKRGTIDLETCKVIPNKTDAPGICSPFIFQIHAFVVANDESTANKPTYRRRVYNLAAPTQSEYLSWLKALKVWIGVKRTEPKLLVAVDHHHDDDDVN